MVTAINALRTAAGLQGYRGATDAASIQALVIDERRRALFLEGFRNYDMQRFNIPFNPAVGTAYPLKGGTYGNTRCSRCRTSSGTTTRASRSSQS